LSSSASSASSISSGAGGADSSGGGGGSGLFDRSRLRFHGQPARGGAAPGEAGAAAGAGGLASGGGEEVVGAADPLALLVDLHRRGAGGEEAFIALDLAELSDSIGRALDEGAGLALRAGDGEGGDEGALDVGSPAVGAGDAARDGFEIEQVAEAGEPLELRPAGEAFRLAAVAEDGEG
jgi:hypothetical protein